MPSGLGLYPQAAEYYGKVAAAPWPDYKLRATVLEGRALLSEGNYREAYPKFKKVADSPVNVPAVQEQKLFAKLGMASCFAVGNKVPEAMEIVHKVINDEDPENYKLFAQAYNVLGTCYMKQDKPKDAILAYLKVDILFYRDAEAHAESLYHLSKLWMEVGKGERARRAQSILKSRYAGSPWANKD